MMQIQVISLPRFTKVAALAVAMATCLTPLVSVDARHENLSVIPYPDPDWPQPTDLESVGMSSARSEVYDAWLRSYAGEDWASVVIKNGYLVYSGHGPHCHVRQKHDCGSIRKPLQGTVLGAALLQGRLKDLDENALIFWKNRFVTPFENDRHITFRQFAQYKDHWNDPEPPGTFFYNNAGATAAGACIAGLFDAVEGFRPVGLAETARKEVMRKLNADWNLKYGDDDFVPGKPGNPGPRMIFESSVYELVKFGYLWLRKGVWKDQRIFSEDYYKDAVTDWSPNTGTTRSSRFGHYGYWWFVNSGQVLLPEVPADTFYHIGSGSPKRATTILIIPSQDVVAVLSMERLSDENRWDVIQNYHLPSNEGPRLWAAEVAKLLSN